MTEHTLFKPNQRVRVHGVPDYLEIYNTYVTIVGVSQEWPEFVMYIIKKEDGTFSNGYSCMTIPSSCLSA